jgi:hypothetical protein
MSVLANSSVSVGEFLLWCLWVFLFVVWFWLLITIFADLFRRHDIGGGMKTLWFIFVILFSFLGIIVYLLTQHEGMADRNVQQMKAEQQQLRQIVGVTPADELIKLDQLKASGSITDEEYQAMKAKAISG